MAFEKSNLEDILSGRKFENCSVMECFHLASYGLAALGRL